MHKSSHSLLIFCQNHVNIFVILWYKRRILIQFGIVLKTHLGSKGLGLNAFISSEQCMTMGKLLSIRLLCPEEQGLKKKKVMDF